MECFTIPEDGSLIRVFHAVPNAAAVDVYVNGNPAFRNLNFRDFTNYIPLTAGTYIVTLYAAGTTAPPLLTSELTVPVGSILTAVASGNIDDLQLLALPDQDSSGVDPTGSKVRAVHLAPNVPAVDLTLDGIPFIENIQFREMTPYTILPSGNYVISILNAQTTDPSLSFRIQLNDNLISTIYLIGESNDLNVLHSIDGSSYLCSSKTPSNG